MSPLLFFDFGVITPSVSFLQLFCEINDVLEDLFISLGSFFTQDCFGWLKVLVRSGWARQKQMGVAEGGGEGDMVGEVEDECWDKNFWKSEQFFRCL